MLCRSRSSTAANSRRTTATSSDIVALLSNSATAHTPGGEGGPHRCGQLGADSVGHRHASHKVAPDGSLRQIDHGAGCPLHGIAGGTPIESSCQCQERRPQSLVDFLQRLSEGGVSYLTDEVFASQRCEQPGISGILAGKVVNSQARGDCCLDWIAAGGQGLKEPVLRPAYGP